MKLKNNKLNNMLSMICNEHEEFAKDLDNLETSLPSKIMKNVKDCKTYEFEDNMYLISLKVNRVFNLYIKIKNTDDDYLLMLEPISMHMLEANKKRNIAVMARKSNNKDKVYNVALLQSGENIKMEISKEIEDLETGDITKRDVSLSIINPSDILTVE